MAVFNDITGEVTNEKFSETATDYEKSLEKELKDVLMQPQQQQQSESYNTYIPSNSYTQGYTQQSSFSLNSMTFTPSQVENLA